MVLVVSSGPQPSPNITRIAVEGTNVVISGNNGVASGHYQVLTSTNLALPLSNWVVLATNTFDAGGNFIFTNAINPARLQLYYLLRLP
jgi:hypothetical protein